MSTTPSPADQVCISDRYPRYIVAKQMMRTTNTKRTVRMSFLFGRTMIARNVHETIPSLDFLVHVRLIDMVVV